MNIRRATKGDVLELVRMERACFTGCYKSCRFAAANFVDYLRAFVLLVDAEPANGTLVGNLAGRLNTCGSRRLARIDSVAVAKRARRRGVGSRLMRRFIGMAKRAGCRAVMLEVAEVNDVGLRVFRGLGFRRVRRLPAFYDGGVDGVRMRLALG